MGVMTSTRRSRLRGCLSGDGGFALVEVMVSAVLLVVLATATLNVIDKSGTASATTRQRAVASGLAQEDQDAMRVMSIANLDQRDTTYTKTVANTTYSVRSVAEWVRDGGRVTCDTNTNRVEYLKTTSYVTWPGHTDNPVILESYLSPGVEAMQKGSLMVKLHTDPGVGVGNQPVTLSTGQSGITDQNGCVLFTGLDAGTTTVRWDGTGGDFVDRNGIQTPSEDVVIGAGQTAQVDRLWDKAGKATVRWVDEGGNPVIPTQMASLNGSPGVTVTNSLITNPASPGQTRYFTSRSSSVPANTPLDPQIAPVTMAGATTTVNELFPYTQTYGIYAGGCASNRPTFTPPTVAIPAGNASSQVDLKLSTISVVLSSGTPSGGGTVTKVKLVNANSTDANCLDTVALNTTPPATTVFRVPYSSTGGSTPYSYNVCVQKLSGTDNYASTISLSTQKLTPATTATSTTINVPSLVWGSRGSTC